MSPWKSGRGGGGVRTLSYTPDLADSGLGGGRGGVLQILTVHFQNPSNKRLILKPPENNVKIVRITKLQEKLPALTEKIKIKFSLL
jgi:hypothetical protein